MTKWLLMSCLAFAVRVAGAEPQANMVVQPLASAAQILIPAAGSAAGANGTYFRSDIAIWNLRDVAQPIELLWLPQAGSATAPVVEATIPAHSALRSEDFVQEVLGHSGVGAIVVTSAAGGGTLDSGGRLQVTSRIWTPQPGNSGTTSQSLPAVLTEGIHAGIVAIFGLRRDDRYRVNVGIVNLDPLHEQTFEVEVTQTRLSLPPEFYSVTVPASSMQQISLNAPLQQPLVAVDVVNTTAAATRSSQWIAYGSSIDNVTGDAWSEIGTPANK
jgi:hypothetical protein